MILWIYCICLNVNVTPAFTSVIQNLPKSFWIQWTSVVLNFFLEICMNIICNNFYLAFREKKCALYSCKRYNVYMLQVTQYLVCMLIALVPTRCWYFYFIVHCKKSWGSHDFYYLQNVSNSVLDGLFLEYGLIMTKNRRWRSVILNNLVFIMLNVLHDNVRYF